jgi:short-subunit dehydrogenase
VSSVAALATIPGATGYCASKAGVEAFGNGLRLELAHHGVDVGVAYFRLVNTDLLPEEREEWGRRSRLRPLKRVYSVEDAADAIARGIEQRARVTCLPGWVPALLVARGVVPSVFGRMLARRAREWDVPPSADDEPVSPAAAGLH